MAVVRGELLFAPGIPMASLRFEDHDALIDAFERRIKGLFVEPISFLQNAPGTEGALFAAALLAAALIESVARAEGMDKERKPIAAWLKLRLSPFAAEVNANRGAKTTAGDVFEDCFRNGLAHNGYVPRLGRLSSELSEPVKIAGDIVTINPFRLASEVDAAFASFIAALRDGHADKQRLAYYLSDQFSKEVTAVRGDDRE